MKKIIISFLFFNFIGLAQNEEFLKPTNEINLKIFEQKEEKILASELQITEKEIYKILEASLIEADKDKKDFIFNIHSTEKENKIYFALVEDFIPTGKENLVGYIEYKKANFLFFSLQKVPFFVPLSNKKEFVLKTSFSCVPKTSKYLFQNGKAYILEYFFSKEYQEPLEIWGMN